MFDDENLVSAAGLVPVMALAEQAGLSELVDGNLRFDCERIASAAANPAGKLTSSSRACSPTPTASMICR